MLTAQGVLLWQHTQAVGADTLQSSSQCAHMRIICIISC